MPNFEVDIDLPIRAKNGKAVNSRRWLEGKHKDLTECLLVVRSNWPEAKIVEVREMTADGEANSLVVFRA